MLWQEAEPLGLDWRVMSLMQRRIAPRRAQRAEKLGGMWFVGRVGQGLRMEPGGEVTA